jgi:bla regulator protein blaR1
MMTENSLSTLWNSVAPAVANHLWQSTLVAMAAGLLTLALRKHRARARHWVWLAASLKFLVPFSVLVTVGRSLAWPRPAVIGAQPSLYFVAGEITHPFAPSTVPVVPQVAPSVATSSWTHILPALPVLWFLGFAAVGLLWIIRWRRIFAAMKSAELVSEGREVGALRRAERRGGIRTPISFLLSRSLLEPGIFGVARPVLLWPEGISPRLDDNHLEAILAHEVWHVRRRDNLCAVLHMLVEAIFWFYPLVWWLGARLVDERERACDEEVLELGGDRQVYAESILKVCEFCLGSPLPCVSGVTGADLKKRMVHIMSDRILHNLGLARKLLLTIAAALAIAIPLTVGLFTPTPSRAQSPAASSDLSAPVFSSVTIKPHESVDQVRTKMMFSLMDGSFVANGVTLQKLIQMAYHVQDAQISGPSDLLNKTKFDIEAKLDPSFVAAMHQQISGGKNLDGQALKSLLADRFKLVAHWEARTMPAYDLLADESGAKLQPAGEQPGMFHHGRGELTSSGTPLELLADQLSARLGLPVVDKTGLKGNYAFNLHWTPNKTEDEHLAQSGWLFAPEPPPDSNGPSLLTALEEQLGLKLEPQTESVQVLVVDHTELPSHE